MNKSETTFIVAAAGEKSGENLPRSEIRRRLRTGKLRESHLIWHPAQQSWKPIRAIPGLKSSQRLPVPAAKHAHTGASPDGSMAKKARPIALGEIDRLYRKNKRSQILYGVLILGVFPLILLLNWLTVDRPLVSAIARSEFKNSISVHGHYRRFVVPGSIVIRLGEISGGMSGEKFVDMLTRLAIATKTQAITGSPYKSVALAKNGVTQFIIRGEAWKELADEQDLSAPQRAMLIVLNLYLPNGKQALGEQSDNPRILFEQKGKLFTDFYKCFVTKTLSSQPAL